LVLEVQVEHQVLEQTVLTLFLVLLLPQVGVAEPQTMEMVQRADQAVEVRLMVAQVRLELLDKVLRVVMELQVAPVQAAVVAVLVVWEYQLPAPVRVVEALGLFLQLLAHLSNTLAVVVAVVLGHQIKLDLLHLALLVAVMAVCIMHLQKPHLQ
jgi:hypothetical protein